MEDRFGTPQRLVEGLQARRPAARARLQELLREPVARLLGELARRYGIDADNAMLTQHALHAAETGLRARPAEAFAGLNWNVFRASALVQIARTAAAPHGAGTPGFDGPPSLPEVPSYHSDTYFRPYSRYGDQFFGGDWYAGRAFQGYLWVFLADVTGHGYFAYLLATALPAVWRYCWGQHPGLAPQPAELLAVMHEQLADSLPEGIFLECTLARFDQAGEVIVSPAGGVRMLLRRGKRPPEVVKLRGAWLGLAAPAAEDQHALRLGEGDELILSTDGAFDQLDGFDAVNGLPREAALFDDLRERLDQSISAGPQKDDVTLVLLRRRAAGPMLLPFPTSRADDVRV